MSLNPERGFVGFIKVQWQLFNLAVMFFTRIPVSKNIPYSTLKMNQANRYFSLVGLIIGSLVSVIYYLSMQLFSIDITIVLIMIISVLLTGAFHEDGLADMADGIGGGYTPEKRLTIMKDSRIGTYGSVALLLTLLLKFYLLVELAHQEVLILSVIFSYGLSRAVAASLIFNTDYVADVDTSKSKPLVAAQSKTELLVLFAFALIPCLFFGFFFRETTSIILVLSVSLFIFRFVFRRWLIARVGGITGDCLGAAQQISELVIYLVIVSQFSSLRIG